MKLNRGNAWRAFALVGVVLAVLVAMSLPAGTRTKAKARRATSLNNLNQFVASSPSWALDQSENFPAAIPLTNSGAMEAATSGKVATATNRQGLP